MGSVFLIRLFAIVNSYGPSDGIAFPNRVSLSVGIGVQSPFCSFNEYRVLLELISSILSSFGTCLGLMSTLLSSIVPFIAVLFGHSHRIGYVWSSILSSFVVCYRSSVRSNPIIAIRHLLAYHSELRTSHRQFYSAIWVCHHRIGHDSANEYLFGLAIQSIRSPITHLWVFASVIPANLSSDTVPIGHLGCVLLAIHFVEYLFHSFASVSTANLVCFSANRCVLLAMGCVWSPVFTHLLGIPDSYRVIYWVRSNHLVWLFTLLMCYSLFPLVASTLAHRLIWYLFGSFTVILWVSTARDPSIWCVLMLINSYLRSFTVIC
jgi:hypothetical protein